MFEVSSKKSGKVYKVYDVIREDKTIWFLLYINGKWEYFIANWFEPHKEIY